MPGLKRSAEDRLPLSLGDLALLGVVFLLACAAFAVEEGLIRDLRAGGGWSRSGGPADVVRVVSAAGRSVRVNGKEADPASAASAVRAVLAAGGEPLVVVEVGPGADCDLTMAVLDEVRSSGASRVKLLNRSP